MTDSTINVPAFRLTVKPQTVKTATPGGGGSGSPHFKGLGSTVFIDAGSSVTVRDGWLATVTPERTVGDRHFGQVVMLISEPSPEQTVTMQVQCCGSFLFPLSLDDIDDVARLLSIFLAQHQACPGYPTWYYVAGDRSPIDGSMMRFEG